MRCYQVITFLAVVVLTAAHPLSAQNNGGKTFLENNGIPLLEKAGLEPGQLNHVRNKTVEAFVEEEFELFADLAIAMKELESNPPAIAAEPFQLLEALQTPITYRGKYVKLTGTVRRISSVKITSDRLREMTGQDAYYHVDFFVSTNKTNFHLKDFEGEVVIGGTFGLTLIYFDLPDLVRDAEKHTLISVPGFYLKNWAHKTAETRDVSSELRRPNPIVIGIGSLTKTVDVSQAGDQVGKLIGWLLGLLLAAVAAFGVWQLRASFGRRRSSAGFARGDRDPIDFSNLES